MSNHYVDNRTEDQKIEAVRASLTMAGQALAPDNECRARKILRGEMSGDEAALEIMIEHGAGDCERAQFLRERIKQAQAH
ncbi:MAG: hypothetical protein SPJ78_05430 [Corynebacterium camporealensis]|uniref:hypothetical protein n=1 Tax=Corynebacterium camporealensis TaxID=161896 RepID=UPI002A91651F|nr:hypothetical protein [Corynebacterium camporealensis]MDY5840144.1 hypothetical protein [Corynebacterium camporealensis]